MADMASVQLTFPKWTLTDDESTLEECARELWADYSVGNQLCRGTGQFTDANVYLQIIAPPSVIEARSGQIVIVLNGVPESMSPAEFVARGLSGTDSS